MSKTFIINKEVDRHSILWSFQQTTHKIILFCFKQFENINAKKMMNIPHIVKQGNTKTVQLLGCKSCMANCNAIINFSIIVCRIGFNLMKKVRLFK